MTLSLSIRLGIDVDVIETWDMDKIQEYVCVISEMNAPPKKKRMTDEEIEAAFNARAI